MIHEYDQAALFATSRTMSAAPIAARKPHMSSQNGRKRVFHTACSGHCTKKTPKHTATSSSTSVDRRRYQPAAMIATPASTQIHHGSHSVGEMSLPVLRSRRGDTPRTMPSIVCLTGFGSRIQYGSLNELPVENTLA